MRQGLKKIALYRCPYPCFSEGSKGADMTDDLHAFLKIRLAEMQQSITDNGRHPGITYDLILLFQAVDRLLEQASKKESPANERALHSRC